MLLPLAGGLALDADQPAPRMARHQCAAEEGLVAAAYERQYAQHSRLYQVAKLHLFGASSGEPAAGRTPLHSCVTAWHV